MAEDGAGNSRDTEHGLGYRLELWSAAMLAAATLATAFSAYQATRWSGRQATRFTEASATRTESAKAQSNGTAGITIDANLFTQWATAVSQGNERLEDTLRHRFFRDEFKPAFEAWRNKHPLENEAAPNTPFSLKRYHPRELERAKRLENEATTLFDEGRDANQTSDNYVLATIFFAAVLFFAGLASKFASTRITIATLTFGTLMFLAGLARLATLPFL